MNLYEKMIHNNPKPLAIMSGAQAFAHGALQQNKQVVQRLEIIAFYEAHLAGLDTPQEAFEHFKNYEVRIHVSGYITIHRPNNTAIVAELIYIDGFTSTITQLETFDEASGEKLAEVGKPFDDQWDDHERAHFLATMCSEVAFDDIKTHDFV